MTSKNISQMSDTEVVSEAHGYGLDVEADRADMSILRDDLRVLRNMGAAARERAVASMNDGWPLNGLPEDWDQGLVRLSDAWSDRS